MFSRTSTKGFTLVETLIAISVLLIVIVGPMTIAQKGIQSSFFSSDQVTATFLAQEAIEAIRELRDNVALDELKEAEDDNYDSETTWDWFTELEEECDDGCSFDIEGSESGMFRACGSDDDCGRIYIDEGSGSDETYRYVTSPTSIPSPFTRVVQIVDPENGQNGAEIIVTVSWRSAVFGEAPRVLTMRTWIYNHYERYGIEI